MMKKILILSIFALAAGLVSCRKEAETAVPEESVATGGRLCVTGSISDDASAGDSDATKTAFTCSSSHILTPVWKEGDEIIGLWGENKSVTWSVKELSDDDKAVFEYVSGTEPWEAGTVVNVIYAPGKRASDISGTGDERTLAFDLSSQAGTIDALGDYALMTGKGVIAGTDLALTFAHALAIVSLDTLKDLTASESGYSVSIKGDSLSNCGTFGFGADGALTFTRGADGAIGTSGTFTANENGELSPVFFALPQANFGDITVFVAKGIDTVKYNLEVNREMMAGNYYYKASLASGRDVSLSFSSVSGVTLNFEAGKYVKVSDGLVSEDCVVKVSGNSAKIKTTLEGDLVAVYPSSAAIMDNQNITGVKVPAIQSGSLEDVACGLANIASDATAAEFSTQAIFAITPPASARTFKVRSLKPVIDNVARTGTAVAINNVGSTGADKCVITVSGDVTLPATCYVSLLPGVRLSDLSFDASFDSSDKGAAKGIPSSQSDATASVAAGALYSIDGDNWHDYIIVGGKKWATMNIGATALTGEESYGEYFAWAEVVGHKWTAEHGFTNFPEENPDPDRYTAGWDYDWYDVFYIPGSFTPYLPPDFSQDPWKLTYNKYTVEGATLELMDDAAFYNWGGSWRMPTKEEYEGLITGTGTDGHCFDRDTWSVKIKNTDLLFPLANRASMGHALDEGCYYWSKTLAESTPGNTGNRAYCLYMENLSSISCQLSSRAYGMPIRAIAD